MSKMLNFHERSKDLNLQNNHVINISHTMKDWKPFRAYTTRISGPFTLKDLIGFLD